ncbi:MAG: sulfite exporter TauE/SafE family protein [Planctomycetes bacterium]|nr:sulfite exporter TauE/SafE family protein [Planctomycetota bacterium]
MRNLLLVVALLALCPGVALAHPFDDRAEVLAEVLIVRTDQKLESLKVTVQYRYEAIYASFNEAHLELDDDRDGFISASERDSRFAELARDIAAAAQLKVRGKPARLVPRFEEFSLVDLGNPDNLITPERGMDVRNLRIGYWFTFDVELAEAWGPGSHPVEFYFSTRISAERTALTDPEDQLRAFDDRGSRRRAVPTVQYGKTRDKHDVMAFVWEAQTDTTGPAPRPVEPQPAPPVAPDNSAEEARAAGTRRLLETDKERRDESSVDAQIDRAFRQLRDGSAGPLVWLSVLGLMFLLGCYHAVQPGHGKTLVAGYLIGTQGKRTDALFLGVVVTAAHTSGVLALMGGAWIISEIWPGTFRDAHKTMAEWITFGVGATILLMGVGLALKRAGGVPHVHDALGRHIDPRDGRVLDDGHSHDHMHDSEPDLPAHELREHHDHTHDRNHRHHDHAHGHTHHTHEHDHHHVHGHGHDHHHGHTHAAGTGLSRWEVLRLGILGGIIPCPSAFVIGAIAFQQQMYFAGLVMVIVFSLGLALVLATIGLVLVQTKDYLNEKRRTTRSRLYRTLEAKLPVFGALVITLIGAAMVMLAAIRLGWIDPNSFAV